MKVKAHDALTGSFIAAAIVFGVQATLDGRSAARGERNEWCAYVLSQDSVSASDSLRFHQEPFNCEVKRGR